jgi:hypothetical protein
MSKHEMLYIALAVIAVVAIVGLTVWAGRRRSRRLQTTFGPEYDRTVARAGDRKAGERELGGRVERREKLAIVELPPVRRDQYLQSWLQIQAGFVDAPRQSVRQADDLVTQVMRERGYPMAEFEQRAADISVDHPAEVEAYRAAHTVSLASDQNRVSTEDLRQAFTHYRALFERLLGRSGDPGQAATGTGVNAAPAGEVQRYEGNRW